MPIISGNTHAPKYARLNVARLGATRLDYYQPWLWFVVDGVAQTANTRVSGCSIQHNLNGTRSSMRARVQGFTPVAGNPIIVYMGDTDAEHVLFRGNIISVSSTYEGGKPSLVAHDIECLDDSWSLNKRKVSVRFSSTSVSTIVPFVIANWVPAPGPSFVLVDAGLPSIDDFTATNEDVTDILDRLATIVGAHWWMDGFGSLHFTTASGVSTTPVVDAQAGQGIRDIVHTSTVAERVTRVWSRGGGAPALIPVPAGANTIPVADASWFPAAFHSGTDGNVVWASRIQSGTQTVSYVSADRVPTPSPIATTATDPNTPFSSIVEVAELGGFPDRGWAKVNDTYFHYSVKSADDGPGFFFGINTGNTYGSVRCNVEIGDVVTPVPSIEQIPATSEAIPAGQMVNIAYYIEDTVAANSFGDALGGNSQFGTVEAFISDGRLSAEETLKRGRAYLDLRKNGQAEVSFTTRDQTMKVGREISISLANPSISGTFKIQSVSISGLGEASTIFPVRRVTASSQRYSFEDLLRRLKRVEERT